MAFTKSPAAIACWPLSRACFTAFAIRSCSNCLASSPAEGPEGGAVGAGAGARAGASVAADAAAPSAGGVKVNCQGLGVSLTLPLRVDHVSSGPRTSPWKLYTRMPILTPASSHALPGSTLRTLRSSLAAKPAPPSSTSTLTEPGGYEAKTKLQGLSAPLTIWRSVAHVVPGARGLLWNSTTNMPTVTPASSHRPSGSTFFTERSSFAAKPAPP